MSEEVPPDPHNGMVMQEVQMNEHYADDAWRVPFNKCDPQSSSLTEVLVKHAAQTSLRSCGVLVGLAAYADMLDLPTAAD